MGNTFRSQPLPAIYPENKTPFAADIVESAISFAVGTIAFSFILIIPGIRYERSWATIRVLFALFVGAVILICNFGYEWYTDEICVKTQYKGYVFPVNKRQEIEAEVGIHIGLRGFNVTLREEDFDACQGSNGDNSRDYYENRPFPFEVIDYNEAFRWSNPWAQGRLGFGIFAGRVTQEFRAAEVRGMPYPILWIAEYFILDGDQIRWGRKFRLAGWYAHIFLWLSFATYLTTIILFIFVIGTGGWFMLTTGLIMILASFSYAIIIISDPPLVFPFADALGHVVRLSPRFGWSWYLNLITGVVVVLLAIIILLMNHFFPRKIAVVFHHSVVEEDEFLLIEEDDLPTGLYIGRGRGSATRGHTQRRSYGISNYQKTMHGSNLSLPDNRRTNRGSNLTLPGDIQLQEVSLDTLV